MANQSAPQAPALPPVKLKQVAFSFPFLRKEQGQSGGAAHFTDELEIYQLLAGRESSGAYLVSPTGMWHGGIHVTEAGVGQSLDLDAGLRCIADGMLIAFRANKTYPVSEIVADGNESPVQAPYSTGFALVRHTMEFPRGTELTFYSLYMHLMSCEDYGNFPKRDKPPYWPRQWEVTQYAQNRPSPGHNGQVADPSQQGQRIRRSPNGEIIGILPQGARVSIGKKKGKWGCVTDLNGASLYPPEAGGYAEPSSAIDGWIYLGQENGGPVVREVIPDEVFERVVVTANQATPGIPVKAGDLIGHLGRYDSLNQCTSGTRMAHIEVFCDDSIQSLIERGREWIDEHGPCKEDWMALGLPFDPTILRVAQGTVLYQRTGDNQFIPGADPQSRKTNGVQVYLYAELARDPTRRVIEQHPSPDPGYPVSWWHIDGENAQGQPIDGWVCDFNFAGGRVTREFAQQWVDFECLADIHDPAHTIFATIQGWVDYVSEANVADRASRSKLSPLMLKVYDALFTKGDGEQAADELCTLSQIGHGGYRWLMQAESRLIVRHESEWANPSKWRQLIAALEEQSDEGSRTQYEEEQKRIDQLVWWDEVKDGMPDFPSQNVYHINPIAITANFASKNLVCKRCGAIITLTAGFLKKIAPDANDKFVSEMNRASIDLFVNYGINSCRQVKHLLAQAKHETRRFTAFRESLNYISYTGQSLYSMAPTAINNGFLRKNMIFPTHAEKIRWIQSHLIANDAAYGEHCFGATEQLGKDFRGRGLLHLTHYETYRQCAQAIGYPIDSKPEFVEINMRVAIETGLWFWMTKGIGLIADDLATIGDEGVRKVTRPINPGYRGLSERQQFKREISAIFNHDFSSECTDD